MVRRGLIFAALLLAGCGERAPVPDAGESHAIGAAIPPYGPAGGGLGGKYPSPNLNLSSTDGGVQGVLAPHSGGTGLNGPGNDGGVLISNGQAWVSRPIPPPSLQNGDAGEILTAADGGPYWRLPGIVAIDAGTKNQLPTARLVGTIPIDAGTANLLPLARVVPGSAGQIVMNNATPAVVNQSVTGDCTISATGVVTCTQAQAGELTFGASTGSITGAAGATAMGLIQSSTTTSPGAGLLLEGQPCVTTSPCTSGDTTTLLYPPVGAGAESHYYVDRGTSKGTHYWVMGGYTGAATTDAALYGGPGASAVLANLVIDTTGTATYFNGHTSTHLSIDDSPLVTAANLTQFDVSTAAASNLTLFALGSTGAYNGGVQVVLTYAATTAPSSPPASGRTFQWSSATGYVFEGSGGTITTIPP